MPAAFTEITTSFGPGSGVGQEPKLNSCGASKIAAFTVFRSSRRALVPDYQSPRRDCIDNRLGNVNENYLVFGLRQKTPEHATHRPRSEDGCFHKEGSRLKRESSMPVWYTDESKSATNNQL